MADRRSTIVKDSDMSEEMINEACEVALQAVKNEVESEIAGAISAHFNQKYHPTWHCIAGRNFAADFAYEGKNFCFFYVGQIAILLWQTT